MVPLLKSVFLDLAKAPSGVGGELMYKASGFVNRGVDVTLGNLKARIAATGNFSVQLSTVSGSYSVYGSHYLVDNGSYSNGIDGSSPRSITTTPTYINSGNNFLMIILSLKKLNIFFLIPFEKYLISKLFMYQS